MYKTTRNGAFPLQEIQGNYTGGPLVHVSTTGTAPNGRFRELLWGCTVLLQGREQDPENSQVGLEVNLAPIG